MKILLYAGPAPWRDTVLEFSAQIVQHAATSLTLVTGDGEEGQALLSDAVERLEVPAHVPMTLRTLPDHAQAAILTAAHEQDYDLVIFGRFRQRLERFFFGTHSKEIARQLEPSVLRVHGTGRPVRHILLASGGDYHSFHNAHVTAQLAAPLNATVTILHVRSQQSLIFEGFPLNDEGVAQLLAGNSPEAIILRDVAIQLNDSGVPVNVKIRNGYVFHEILNELQSGNYELLVIGAHRVASVLDRILLEDITGDLLDLCPLPVLVVKPNQS